MEIENWYIHYRIKYKELNIDFKFIDDLKIFFVNQSNDYFQDFFIWFFRGTDMQIIGYREPI